MAKALRIAVGDLPDAPLQAAAAFHASHVTDILAQAKGVDVTTLLLPPADHTHRNWRLAVVQEMARVVAPARLNAVAGADQTGLVKAAGWLEGAAGVTGHLLAIEDVGQ